MAELGLAEFDRLLQETRKVLESAGTARAAGEAAEPGTGQAAGGRVRAVAAGRRLRALDLDPQVMRMPSRELAAAVVAAVNAALDEASTASAAMDVDTSGVEHLDPRALAARVAEIQDEGIRQMAAIGQAISAAMARLQAER